MLNERDQLAWAGIERRLRHGTARFLPVRLPRDIHGPLRAGFVIGTRVEEHNLELRERELARARRELTDTARTLVGTPTSAGASR